MKYKIGDKLFYINDYFRNKMYEVTVINVHDHQLYDVMCPEYDSLISVNEISLFKTKKGAIKNMIKFLKDDSERAKKIVEHNLDVIKKNDNIISEMERQLNE